MRTRLTISKAATTMLGAFLFAALSHPALALVPPPEARPVTDPQPPGALSGASVFVSAGHGWYYNDKGRWVTQRGNSFGVLEDHSNAESVNQYLVKYLWNLGARVYTTRERCMNTNMVIVDSPDNGLKLEGAWDRDVLPQTWKGGQYRATTVKGEPTATATFTPTIPEDGHYGVYIWYREAPPRRDGASFRIPQHTTRDARININHSGGTTTWTQDQNRDGRTWKYIGQYYFEKGANPETGSIVINNSSTIEGRAINVDAVRFGGGMGDVIVGGAPSGKPRWEESGLLYSPFMGYNAPEDTRRFNSVSAMPMWAEWEMEEWEKGSSVYISWHTNASGTANKARGLFSFAYGPNAWSTMADFIGYPLGDKLLYAVHDSIIRDVHNTFDPVWRDGAKVTRWLGEVNPRNNSKMPAALFEYGFHDHADDAAYILDPKFRNTVSRGTARGVVDFYVNNMKGFTNSTFLPEPPIELVATADEEKSVKLAWLPGPDSAKNPALGAPAAEYRVQHSRNGKGFDNGFLTVHTDIIFPNVEPGTHFFRVSARNVGGESFPSETLTVHIPEEATDRVLIVSGYDRLDRSLNLVEPSGVERGILEKMNTFDYTIQHGKALAAAGYTFDSINSKALRSLPLTPEKYPAVVWILGQQTGADETISPENREYLYAYLAAGGTLMISGTEYIDSLAKDAEANTFLTETLRVSGTEVKSDTFALEGGTDTNFSALKNFTIDDGTGRTYPVQSPKVLLPGRNSRAAIYYKGTDDRGRRRAAAIQVEDANLRVFVLGFPFETIKEDDARTELMARAMGFLLGTEEENNRMAMK